MTFYVVETTFLAPGMMIITNHIPYVTEDRRVEQEVQMDFYCSFSTFGSDNLHVLLLAVRSSGGIFTALPEWPMRSEQQDRSWTV
jgi:hypothetical protein